MKTKKFLITGGAGFIGSHLVDALVESGGEVTVVDIKPVTEATNLVHQLEKIRYVEGDICDEKLMNEVCKGQRYVIHLAAIVSVPLSVKDPVTTHKINVDGTLSVFEAAKNNGIKRLVYASSAAVYGNTDSLPVPEEEKLRPQSPYALHKMINEMYGHYYSESGQLETIGLRYFNVFGLRQDPSSPYSGVISLLRKHLLEGTKPTIFGTGEQTRDFVSVKDVVAANLLALENGVPGSVYNIGTEHEISLNELISLIENITVTPFLTNAAPVRPGDIERSCASIQRAKTELGYSPEHILTEELKELLEVAE